MKNEHYDEVTIVELNAIRVACHQTFSTEPEEEGRAFLTRWYTQHINPDLNQARIFGFDIDVGEEQAKQGLRGYEFWITIPEGVHPSAGVNLENFAGGLYAMMRINDALKNPYELIPPGWEKLHQWVLESDQYSLADHQWLEEAGGPTGHDLDLYHPIKLIGK